MLHMTVIIVTKEEKLIHSKAELVFMEYILQEQVLHLSAVPVKEPHVLECVKITKQSQT